MEQISVTRPECVRVVTTKRLGHGSKGTGLDSVHMRLATERIDYADVFVKTAAKT